METNRNDRLNINQRNDMVKIYKLIGGNPGAITVVTNLLDVMEEYEENEGSIIQFINELLNRNIVGPRLWYLYKNEAHFDIHNLIGLELDNYDDNYFHHKFEKYL